LEREKTVAKALETVETQTNRGAAARAAEAGEGTNDNPPRQKQRSGKGSSGNPEIDQSFAEVKALSARALGDHTRVYHARTDSGIYRGEILGETQHHLVQKLSQQSTVAHVKHLLSPVPSV